jgi:hypothetical protein
MHVEEKETFWKHGILGCYMEEVGALVMSQSDEQATGLMYLTDRLSLYKNYDIQ